MWLGPWVLLNNTKSFGGNLEIPTKQGRKPGIAFQLLRFHSVSLVSILSFLPHPSFPPLSIFSLII